MVKVHQLDGLQSLNVKRSCLKSVAFPEAVAKEALRLASNKLPIRTKIVSREEVGGQSNEGQRNYCINHC